MQIADFEDVTLHWREDGDPAGIPLVFAHSLGTDLRLWDQVVAVLPLGARIIRYDMRGHGLSACPAAPYAMETLVRDAERLLEHLGISDCVFIGLSIGGMVAQGLAFKRPDQVRALVLSNTAVKMGTAAMWEERITAIRSGGIAALSDAILERWFSPDFRRKPELALWRAILERTPVEGYVGCSAAIAATDFLTSTSRLRLPVLGIAGSKDGASPPDLVREMMGLIPDAEFALIQGAGHLPCVEQPETYADLLSEFVAGLL